MSDVVFKLKPNPTFTVPVEIPRPGEAPAKISVTFKHKTRNELDEYLKRASGAKAEHAIPLFKEIVSDWAGPDMPFDDESVGLLLQNYQGAMRAVVDAYIVELTQARRKN